MMALDFRSSRDELIDRGSTIRRVGKKVRLGVTALGALFRYLLLVGFKNMVPVAASEV